MTTADTPEAWKAAQRHSFHLPPSGAACLAKYEAPETGSRANEAGAIAFVVAMLGLLIAAVVIEDGQRVTFRAEPDGPLAFWTVEIAGRIYRSPLRAIGTEQPAFFRALAETTVHEAT